MHSEEKTQCTTAPLKYLAIHRHEPARQRARALANKRLPQSSAGTAARRDGLVSNPGKETLLHFVALTPHQRPLPSSLFQHPPKFDPGFSPASPPFSWALPLDRTASSSGSPWPIPRGDYRPVFSIRTDSRSNASIICSNRMSRDTSKIAVRVNPAECRGIKSSLALGSEEESRSRALLV